jgi:hypothetical protein
MYSVNSRAFALGMPDTRPKPPTVGQYDPQVTSRHSDLDVSVGKHCVHSSEGNSAFVDVLEVTLEDADAARQRVDDARHEQRVIYSDQELNLVASHAEGHMISRDRTVSDSIADVVMSSM